MTDTKQLTYRDLEGLLYFIQKQAFKEVYGVELCFYEEGDLQGKVDKLEEDGEFPVCYYKVKEYLERLKEGYY